MVKTQNKSILWWLAMFVVLLLLGLTIYRVSAALYHNDRLQKEFTAGPSPSPYQQGIPMEEMGFVSYSSYFPNIFAMSMYDLKSHIESPVTIRYYSDISNGDAIPALEIKKGTTIVAFPEKTRGSQFYEVGYGFTSFPTYDQGWRYVRPFLLADEEDQTLYEQYYYVRIETLEAVIKEIIQDNKSVRVAVRQQGWSVDTGKNKIATYIDQLFYQLGFYLSPDLFYKVIDRWTVILMASIGLILFTMTLGRKGWLLKKRT